MRTALTVGVVGLGAKGRSLAAAVEASRQARVSWLCDTAARHAVPLAASRPEARFTSRLDDLLEDEAVDAVVVATPLHTHHEIVRRALEHDKHVLVDTVLTPSTEDADELVRLAERRRRRLAVADGLRFHPGVRKLKELIDRGELGETYYVVAERQTLGEPGYPNVLWSLGGAEAAVLLDLLGDEPVGFAAQVESYVEPGVPDVAFCYLRFATGIRAQLHLSCLGAPRRRTLTVVGSNAVARLDMLAAERPLSVYEKRLMGRGSDRGDNARRSLGNVVQPELEECESPLALECERFLTSIRAPARNRAGGPKASGVVAVLDGLDRAARTGVVGDGAVVGGAEIIQLPLQLQ